MCKCCNQVMFVMMSHIYHVGLCSEHVLSHCSTDLREPGICDCSGSARLGWAAGGREPDPSRASRRRPRTHARLSAGVRARTRSTSAREAARETATKCSRTSAQNARREAATAPTCCQIHSVSSILKSIPPYFNPAGSRSQPDHTTQTGAAETRAFTAPPN